MTDGKVSFSALQERFRDCPLLPDLSPFSIGEHSTMLAEHSVKLDEWYQEGKRLLAGLLKQAFCIEIHNEERPCDLTCDCSSLIIDDEKFDFSKCRSKAKIMVIGVGEEKKK